MGQQCVREGSDDEREVEQKGIKPPQPPPSQQGGNKAKGNKYAASERIISLEHVEHPHARLCEAMKLEKNFREFSRLFPIGEAALCVAACDTYGPGQKQLITAGEDRSMSILNYETGHVMKQWKRAHERDINCVTNPDAATGIFLTGSRDTTVRIWKPTESAPLHILKGHKLNVSSVAMHEGGTMACSGSRDNSVRLWDLETAEQLSCQDVKLNLVHFVRWIEPLGCIAQGGEDLTLRLWDVRTEGKRSSLELRDTFANFDYHPICCDGMTNRPDRCHLLYTGHNGFNNQGSMIYEWDLRTGRRVRQFNGHSFTVRAIHLLKSEAFSRVGLENTLVSAGEDGSIRFWPLTPSASSNEGNADLETEEPHKEEPQEHDASHGDAQKPVAEVEQLDVCQHFELQEGRVTGLDETKEGLILCSLRNGTLVILKPSGSVDAPRPVQRFRYVGNPGAVS